MEEIEQKTITDKELWKKAENINKAKFLTLMGQSPKTAWILAIIGIVVVLGLALLVPNPDPKIKFASQSGDMVAVLTENKLLLADKTNLKLKEVDIEPDNISVAAGKDLVALASRIQNKVSLYDWSGNKLSEIQVDAPTAIGVGSSWIYIYSGDGIKVYKDGKEINSLSIDKQMKESSKITKSIQETDAVWVQDYMSLWKSGPFGWTPIPLEFEDDYKSAWISDKITLQYKEEIIATDLLGKTIEKSPLPAWATSNSWLCFDLISIDSGKLMVGSVKESAPVVFDLRK